MATLVAAMATSHAFALMDPAAWDDFLERNRQGYRRRYGVMPAMSAEYARESMEGIRKKVVPSVPTIEPAVETP